VSVALSAQAFVSPVSVRTWSELEFAAGKSAWQGLLRRASANPLFMSWEWQSRWWRLHGAALHGELALLAAYAGDGSLVGLAPLYRRDAAHRWGVRAARLELIGSAFRGPAGITFSEYLDFIVDHAWEEAVLAAFSAHLLGDGTWSDFVAVHTREDGMAARAVEAHLLSDCQLRAQDGMTAYAVELPARFEEYLAALKPGIRRKVWNRRRRLTTPILRFAREREIEPLLRQIARFQTARWGTLDDAEGRLGFHAGFASAMARQDALRLSVLLQNGEPISAMYNVELDGTEYNLQSGFSPAAAPLSPSYLHFGYCLESAARRGVRAFDFLAGSGRSRDYKQDFGTRTVRMATLQVIRDPVLQRLYRLYDGAPVWVRKLSLCMGRGSVRHA
jgi:CelD/BcsL family acetyltransferase involved in cellulose biosynthesis